MYSLFFSFTSTILSKVENGSIDSHEIVHCMILAVGIGNLILTFFADDPPIYSDLTNKVYPKKRKKKKTFKTTMGGGGCQGEITKQKTLHYFYFFLLSELSDNPAPIENCSFIALILHR